MDREVKQTNNNDICTITVISLLYMYGLPFTIDLSQISDKS